MIVALYNMAVNSSLLDVVVDSLPCCSGRCPGYFIILSISNLFFVEKVIKIDQLSSAKVENQGWEFALWFSCESLVFIKAKPKSVI